MIEVATPSRAETNPGAVDARLRGRTYAITFDRAGKEVNPDLQTMTPARLLVARVLPTPESLGVSYAAYLHGMGEAVGRHRSRSRPTGRSRA